MSDHITRALEAAVSNVHLDTDGVFAREVALLGQLRMPIEAIKKIRAATGLGLKESKDFFEAFRDKVQVVPMRYDGVHFQDVWDSIKQEMRERQIERMQQENLELRNRLGCSIDEALNLRKRIRDLEEEIGEWRDLRDRMQKRIDELHKAVGETDETPEPSSAFIHSLS
jgi:chromosome segregation ATPase